MFKQTKLINGLDLITVPMQGTQAVTVLVMIGAGSKYENRKNNGISHFLEHMFFKGTTRRPDTLALSAELDSIGADFNAFTTKEYTGYWIKADSSKAELAIDILSDMLQNSKFDKEEIEREKGVIIEEINMYHENPMMYIEDVFEDCLYGDTPAGWEIIGPKANILKFDRQVFIDYIKNQYSSRNTKICIAGKIDNKIINLTKKYFGKFNDSKTKNKLKTIEKQASPKVMIKYKEGEQVNLALGVRAYPVGHKDELALKILGIILGGSMSSRLFINLRERNGLAYYVRTQVENYTDTGYLATFAGVPKDKIEEAIKIIIEEYNKIKNEIVNEEELRRVKDMVKGRTVLGLESSDNLANWYAKQLTLRNKANTPEEYFKKIEKISAKDIQRVAKEIFVNKGLNLAIIGPHKDGKKFKVSL
jgi:predicted Zn-dependent peptidase